MDEQLNYIGPLMAKILTDAPFIEADVTFDEAREYPYMFNVTAFDTVTMKWTVVCRIQSQGMFRMHMPCASDRQARQKKQCRTTTCIPK